MSSTESTKDSTMSGAATEPNGTNGGTPASAEHPHPDKSIANIYEQNQIWKNKKLAEDKDFFNKLGSGHSPDYMWIGKSVKLPNWCL
jgi:hypothetical protein